MLICSVHTASSRCTIDALNDDYPRATINDYLSFIFSSQTHDRRADPALIKALARAFRYQRLLDDGRYVSISEMAAAEKIERGYMGSLLRLTLLAPDIVSAILDGSQPEDVRLPCLHESLPAGWADQRNALGVQ